MTRFPRILLLALALSPLATKAGWAQEHWHGERHQRFTSEHWREGRWVHGRHLGRFGWWWVIGASWYFYPSPIRPYPEPPVVVVTPPLPAQLSPQYAYYCPNPSGYYPAQPQCPSGWQLIPVSPQPAAPPPLATPAPIPVAPSIDGTVAGGQFGHGSGKRGATALGSLLGAFVGHDMGASLDRADQIAAERAEQAAYGAPLGQAIAWNNPESGHSGTITPLRDGADSEGHYCREFQQTVSIGGNSEQAQGTACRQPDGSWRLVNR